MAVFELNRLSFSYNGSTEKALDNISLSVDSGDFFILCGASGSGKSTLLRQLKTDLAPSGIREGEILFNAQPLGSTDRRTQSEKIGFVSQSPENQIVTDKVWHELAFGLESLGYTTAEIRGRVAEMAAFFGIEKWFHMSVTELSGGQKQLLNLAAVMTLHPSVLVLDEPTSQLDPIAASGFLNVLKKINNELGVTIILTEHRLEEAFPLANRGAVMEQGRVVCSGTPKELCHRLRESGSPVFLAMPVPVRIWAAVASDSDCPITVSEGRKWLAEFAERAPVGEVSARRIPRSDETAVSISEAWFRYEKDGADIIRGLGLEVKKGEFLAILGGNGAGKTTTLKLIGGIKKPYRGSIRVSGKTAALPQNPQALFVKNSVREELTDMCGADRSRFDYVVSLCKLGALLERHPYDLSGGEQQRLALAKILIPESDILLLDEPTKSVDAEFRRLFGNILEKLIGQGMTIIMVSHDIEFCAEYAHRCAMFFDGSIVTDGTPTEFFGGNSFYTTSANRMARDIIPEAITADDVILACGGEVPEPVADYETEHIEDEKKEEFRLPLWRRITAAVSGIVAAAVFLYATKITDLSKIVSSGGLTLSGSEHLRLSVVFIAALFMCALSVYKKPEAVHTSEKHPTKRNAPASAAVLLLVPLTLWLGIRFFGIRQYYLLSLLCAVESLSAFAIAFEGRKPQPRELVTIASLCAIGIAGRAVFFMLPQFKPVAAVVIISGIAFGGETGFLVGAMTMLASDMFFSQGAWTPFQMFAMGMVGFVSGLMFRYAARTRLSVCIFGALAVFVIYGGIMNPVSALISGSTLNAKTIAAYYVTGLPMDLVHSAATALFLWFGAELMLEKLERVKLKL